ncbi:MAG: hypothetical protein ACR2G7_12310 [Acidimicrobiales bacterium]
MRGLGQRLAEAARSDDERQPRDSGHLGLMEASFAHVRVFAPHVLAGLSFAASVSPHEVLDAVALLQAMNDEGRRHAPNGPDRVHLRPLAALPEHSPGRR